LILALSFGRVNPSEIKDLVTQLHVQHDDGFRAVSILQKSRTWLHEVLRGEFDLAK